MAINKIKSKSIEDDAITSAKVADGVISAADVADGTLTSAKLSYPLTTFSSTGIDDNATSTAITIDSSQNVGIGETSPLGKLHIKTADSGATSFAAGDEFVVEGGNGNIGMSFLSTGGNGQFIYFGDDADNNIGSIKYEHSDNSLQFVTNTSEAMRIDSSGNVGIGTTSPSSTLHISGDPQVTLTQPNSLVLQNDTDSATSGDAKTGILFRANYSGTTPTDLANITAGKQNTVNGNYDSFIGFCTRTYGVNELEERMRITAAGKVLINTTVSDNGNVTSSGDGTSGNGACYGLVRGSSKATLGMDSVGGMNIRNFSGEIYVTDAGGNNTTISPHNFSVIPDGSSENLAWSYYTRQGDVENDFDNTKYISADITKVIRKVENLTGEKLIYTGTGNTDDGSTVSQNIIQSLIDRIETLEAKVQTLENNQP